MGLFRSASRKRWERLLDGDILVALGTGHFECTLPVNTHVRSRGAIAVGKKTILLSLTELRKSPINTIRLLRSETLVQVKGAWLIQLSTPTDGHYVLTELRPEAEIRRALLAELQRFD